MKRNWEGDKKRNIKFFNSIVFFATERKIFNLKEEASFKLQSKKVIMIAWRTFQIFHKPRYFSAISSCSFKMERKMKS